MHVLSPPQMLTIAHARLRLTQLPLLCAQEIRAVIGAEVVQDLPASNTQTCAFQCKNHTEHLQTELCSHVHTQARAGKHRQKGRGTHRHKDTHRHRDAYRHKDTHRHRDAYRPPLVEEELQGLWVPGLQHTAGRVLQWRRSDSRRDNLQHRRPRVVGNTSGTRLVCACGVKE